MLKMSIASSSSSLLILPDFAIMLDVQLSVCHFTCFFLNKFFIESKEYLIASSSLNIELLVSSIKLKVSLHTYLTYHFHYKLMLDLSDLRQNN